MKSNKLKLLIGMLLLSFMTGCTKEEELDVLKVATLNGPTGMGMVELLDDEDKYEVTLYKSPDEIVGKVVSGEVDLACVPSNMGSVLYNKTEKQISVVGVNTLGVLYLVQNGEGITSIDDLKGKTIIASGKGGTPEYVLTQILTKSGLEVGKDVQVEYLANHADVTTKLMSQEGNIALLPEPYVTIAKGKSESLKVAIDLNAEWTKIENSKLPMGIIIAQNDIINNKEKELQNFMSEYEKSVQFVNEKPEEAAKLIAENEIVPEEAIALQAIPNCNIVYLQGEDAKKELESFYEILESFNPKAIGGTLPDEAFYYIK